MDEISVIEEGYSIELADGTVLEDVWLNGNNWICPGELDEDAIFYDMNLSPVIITRPDGTDEYHPYMQYFKPWQPDDGNTYFILEDKPLEEIEKEQFNAAIAVLAQATLDDETAESAAILFPEWSGAGVSYFVNDRVRYDGRLAKCIQAHTSQEDWAPGTAPSLWVWISDPDDEWPDWIQPTGAHDAYGLGAKVSHNGKHWVSDADANVWEPGVYGWTEQGD